MDGRYNELVETAETCRQLHVDQLAGQAAEQQADAALVAAQATRDAASAALDEDRRQSEVAEMSEALGQAIARLDWAEVGRLSTAIAAATRARQGANDTYQAAQVAVNQASSAQAAARATVTAKAEARRQALTKLEKLAHSLI